MHRLSEQTYQDAINRVAGGHPDVKKVLDVYGYPPFWHREPGFKTLSRTICEQLLSLKAAKTIFERLEALLDEFSPDNLLAKSDQQLRDSGLSRQKIGTLKRVAENIRHDSLNFEELEEIRDPDEVRKKLTRIKGIGPWTAESFMILSLHHADVFPLGDVAAVNALKLNELVNDEAKKPEIKEYVDQFSPNRTALTLLMWHSYIQRKEISFEP